MTLPALPSAGATGWYGHYAALHNSIAAVRLTPPSGDVTGASDTATIQSNEDAGKHTVLTPGATYYVKGLVKRSNTDIRLNGATIMLPAGANTDVIIGEQFDTLTGTDGTGGIRDFGIYGPGKIDGNKSQQTLPTPTVTSANFNLAPSFTVTLSSTANLGSSGSATVNTQSGPQKFTWSANNTTTNTLTASSATTGRVVTGTPIFIGGYGIRIYGYNFTIGQRLLIRNCVADGLWTEWSATANLGAGTQEMESRVTQIKSYENGRNGYSFMGPHDSIVDNSIFYRNLATGWNSGNGSICYLNTCHGWGSPQIVSFDDHTGSQFINCIGEMTAAAGSRGFRLWGDGAILSGGTRALWAGSGGNVGLELQNAVSGCLIDMTWTGGFGNGAVLFTNSGGGNLIRGIAYGLGSNPIVAGTPAATDVIDIMTGTDTTTPRVTIGQRADVVTNPAGFAGWSYDVAASPSQTAPGSGSIQYVWVKSTDTRVITKLWVGVGTAGAGLTAGQCLLGLYDTAGNRLAVSDDQAAAWTTTGAKAATIPATSVAAGQWYVIALLAVGTTPPAFARGYSAVAGVANAGYTSAPFRFNQGATGQTALPATFTPTSLTAGIAWWVALS